MNSIVIYNNLPGIKKAINKIEDLSDSLTKRIRIYFNNGLQLSIIQGETTYGGKFGLFEIAPFDKNGDMNGKILNFEYDDVEGFLTKEDVFKRIIQIANKEVTE